MSNSAWNYKEAITRNRTLVKRSHRRHVSRSHAHYVRQPALRSRLCGYALYVPIFCGIFSRHSNEELTRLNAIVCFPTRYSWPLISKASARNEACPCDWFCTRFSPFAPCLSSGIWSERFVLKNIVWLLWFRFVMHSHNSVFFWIFIIDAIYVLAFAVNEESCTGSATFKSLFTCRSCRCTL